MGFDLGYPPLVVLNYVVHNLCLVSEPYGSQSLLVRRQMFAFAVYPPNVFHILNHLVYFALLYIINSDYFFYTSSINHDLVHIDI